MSLNNSKINYSQYSIYDEQVILKASSLGMPLIGGTALEVLASVFNKSDVRKRSDNDLDFATNSEQAKDDLQKWVQQQVDAEKVQVDVFLINSHILPKPLIIEVDGVLVMSPEYLIWSKLHRLSEQDKKDIKWLLTITDACKLELWFESLGVTETELEQINLIIAT